MLSVVIRAVNDDAVCCWLFEGVAETAYCLLQRCLLFVVMVVVDGIVGCRR